MFSSRKLDLLVLLGGNLCIIYAAFLLLGTTLIYPHKQIIRSISMKLNNHLESNLGSHELCIMAKDI